MAHESFEDETIAAQVNENFVAIKVDREERPDIDAVYMDATVAMTGHGGWPMTVFLDHDARPFFAGTYFPPAPRHQMPSFPQVLQAIVDTWTTRRTEVEESSQRIVEVLSKRQWDVGDAAVPTLEQLDAAVASLLDDFDDAHGGFGGEPKFPPSMVLEFLIGYQALPGATHGEGAYRMVDRTLTAMARGGMYDQLGGGFARYSVDEHWTVPHFEKMLYDNALLLRVYLHWWRLAGSSLAERVVRETAEFLVRDLQTPEGGFASALDADSEGVEGKFYAWTPQQFVDCLGETDGMWAAEVLSVTDTGTFEHGTSTSNCSTIRTTWLGGNLFANGSGVSGKTAFIQAATTRSWPRGTAWRSRRLPRPANCSTSRRGSRPPSRPATCSSRSTSAPPATIAYAGRHEREDPEATSASSATTPVSRRGLLFCTR